MRDDDTLIADGDGIYDPAAYSDRLVLGLKGTLSEAELHLLKGRLIAGMRHKAAKGELRVALPAGLEYDQDGRPAVCADEAVREAIATVFRRFAELGSARQVMLSLLADGLELPRRRAGGRVVWAPASYGAVIGVLTNPCYAGAFAFGRTRKAGRAGQGRAACGRRPVPMPQWEVLICGHHPGYISWEDYLASQERLHANCSAPRGQGGGAVREGRGLLQGIVRCGRCGRMMRTGYQGGRARHLPRYYCAAEGTYFGRRVYCQGVGGRQIEQAVAGEVLAVLEPAALAATAQALADAEAAPGAAAAGLRAGRRTGPLRRRPGPSPVRRLRAGEPADGPVAGGGLGGPAGRRHPGRGRADRRASPPAQPADGRRLRRAGPLPARLRSRSKPARLLPCQPGNSRCLADVGRQVPVGRHELGPPRLAVAEFPPGEVGGEVFDVDLVPGSVLGEQVHGHAP